MSFFSKEFYDISKEPMTFFTEMQSVSFLTLVLQITWTVLYLFLKLVFLVYFSDFAERYFMKKEKLCSELSGNAFYYVQSRDAGVQTEAAWTEKQCISQYSHFLLSLYLGRAPVFLISCWSLRAAEYRFGTVLSGAGAVPSHWCPWVSKPRGVVVVWREQEDTLCLPLSLRLWVSCSCCDVRITVVLSQRCARIKKKKDIQLNYRLGSYWPYRLAVLLIQCQWRAVLFGSAH